MTILYKVGKLQHSFLSNFIFEQTSCYKGVRKGRDFAGTDFWKFRDNCLKMFSYSFVTFLYKYLFSFLTPFRESGHLLLATVKRRVVKPVYLIFFYILVVCHFPFSKEWGGVGGKVHFLHLRTGRSHYIVFFCNYIPSFPFILIYIMC